MDTNRHAMQQRQTGSVTNASMMNTQRSGGFGVDNVGMTQKLASSQFAQPPNMNQTFDSQGLKSNQWNATQPVLQGGMQGGANNHGGAAANDVSVNLASTQDRKGVQGGIMWASKQPNSMNTKKPYDLDSQAGFKVQNQSMQQTPMNANTDFNGLRISPRNNFASTRSEANAGGKPQQAQQLQNALSSMLLERRNLMDSMRTNKGAGEAQQELKFQLQILNNNIETVQEKIQILEK